MLNEKKQAQDSELYAKREEVSQLEQTNNALSEEIIGYKKLEADFDEKLKEALELKDFTTARQKV